MSEEQPKTPSVDDGAGEERETKLGAEPAPTVFKESTEGEESARAQLDWYRRKEERDKAHKILEAEYRKDHPLTADEIDGEAAGILVTSRIPDEVVAREMSEDPASEVSWYGLEFVSKHLGIDEARSMYGRVAKDAQEDFEGGHGITRSVAPHGLAPLETARLHLIRKGLRREWKPVGMTEDLIIDMMVQVRFQYERWMQKHSEQTEADWLRLTAAEEVSKQYGQWVPPRLSDAESQLHSMNLALKWQNQFIKLVRSLRDLRRYQPVIGTMVINQAGQVNVAERQVNIDI